MAKKEPKNTEAKGMPENPAEEMVKEEQLKLVKRHANAEKLLGVPYDFDEQQRLAKQEWNEAQGHAQAAVYKMLQLGKRLFVINEMEGQNVTANVCSNIGVGERKGFYALSLYKKVGDTPPPALIDAGPSKMLEVFKLPEDEREEALETGLLDGDEVAQMPVRKLRELVRKLKAESAEQRDRIRTGSEQNDKLSAEVSALRAGQRSADDVEAQRSINDYMRDFDQMLVGFTTLPFDSLSDKTLAAALAMIDKWDAELTLARKHLDDVSGIYHRLDAPVTDAEADSARGQQARARRTLEDNLNA